MMLIFYKKKALYAYNASNKIFDINKYKVLNDKTNIITSFFNKSNFNGNCDDVCITKPSCFL